MVNVMRDPLPSRGFARGLPIAYAAMIVATAKPQLRIDATIPGKD